MKTDVSILNSENGSLYCKMSKYLSEKRLKKSEYLRVCDDIVLMLLGAQERGEKAEQLFPEGYEKFLDEVAENCVKVKWYETLLSVLFWTVTVFSAAIFILVLSIVIWDGYVERVSFIYASIEVSSLIGVFLAAGAGMSISVLSSKLTFKKFIYNRKPGFYLYALLIIVAAFGIWLALHLGIYDGSLVSINWVLLGCASAGVAVVLAIVRFVLTKF